MSGDIREEIGDAIDERIESQDSPRGSWERIGNSRFIARDGIGGMAEVQHENLAIHFKADVDSAELKSREKGLEIEVDHDPVHERDWRQATVESQTTEQSDSDILAQVPGEEALEGVEGYEDLTRPAQKVVDELDMEHLKDRLTGRDGGLRPSKPSASGDTGLEQYVWRMARFHSGDDPKLPVTATWWLQDWLDDQNIEAEVSGIMDKPGKQITALLGAAAQAIVASFGRNPTGGVEIWQDAVYGQ